MSDTTHLYLLQFPKKGVIKIGKANDIGLRIRALRPHWGEVDYEASHYWRVPASTVFKIEKGLQALLSAFAVDAGEGDGKTELFTADALGIALQYIKVYRRTAPGCEPVRKGVPRLLAAPSAASAQRRRRRDSLLRRSASMESSVIGLARAFHRINRLLSILYRRQHRIAYEYDTDGRTIRFRVRESDRDRRRDTSSSVMDYMQFKIEDLNGYLGMSACSTSGIGDVSQYTIRLHYIDRETTKGHLLAYFLEQTEVFLNRLPQHSPAAAAHPLPPIDENEVLDRLLGMGE